MLVIPLPETPMRSYLTTVDRQAELAGGDYNTNLVRTLGELDNLQIIDARRNQTDRHYRCDNYALGERLGIDWARPGLDIPAEDVLRDNRRTLERNGFQAVGKLAAGDLVVYGDNDRRVYHFGILEDVRKLVVTSKWGSGPIIRHPLGLVYSEYGQRAVFYRLQKTN